MTDPPGRLDHLFEPLDPPPGGPAALRARFQRERTRQRHRRLLALTTGALAAAVALWTALAPRGTPPPSPAFDLARMRVGLIPPPADVLTILATRRGTVAEHRHTSDNGRIVIYRIATLPD